MDKISREYLKNNTGITIKQVPLVLFDEKTIEIIQKIANSVFETRDNAVKAKSMEY